MKSGFQDKHHSGEHIVSGLVHRFFGYHNVGFHLGDGPVTMDFSGPLNEEELRRVELEANRAVAANLQVQVVSGKGSTCTDGI